MSLLASVPANGLLFKAENKVSSRRTPRSYPALVPSDVRFSSFHTDILPSIGTGFMATGFVGALQAGSYAFWIQETATGSAVYNFDFRVSAVPEASTSLMLMAGLVGLAGLRFSRRR